MKENPVIDDKQLLETQITVEENLYRHIDPYRKFYLARSDWHNSLEDVLFMAHEVLNDNRTKSS